MATGDVIVETTNLKVSNDESHTSGLTAVQSTTLQAGTTVVSANGSTHSGPFVIPGEKSVSDGRTVETAFDSSKTYILTITEG